MTTKVESPVGGVVQQLDKDPGVFHFIVYTRHQRSLGASPIEVARKLARQRPNHRNITVHGNGGIELKFFVLGESGGDRTAYEMLKISCRPEELALGKEDNFIGLLIKETGVGVLRVLHISDTPAIAPQVKCIDGYVAQQFDGPEIYRFIAHTEHEYGMDNSVLDLAQNLAQKHPKRTSITVHRKDDGSDLRYGTGILGTVWETLEISCPAEEMDPKKKGSIISLMKEEGAKILRISRIIEEFVPKPA